MIEREIEAFTTWLSGVEQLHVTDPRCKDKPWSDWMVRKWDSMWREAMFEVQQIEVQGQVTL